MDELMSWPRALRKLVCVDVQSRVDRLYLVHPRCATCNFGYMIYQYAEEDGLPSIYVVRFHWLAALTAAIIILIVQFLPLCPTSWLIRLVDVIRYTRRSVLSHGSGGLPPPPLLTVKLCGQVSQMRWVPCPHPTIEIPAIDVHLWMTEQLLALSFCVHKV